MICGDTKTKKKKQKKLHGARKPRKDEEMAWAPPRKKSKWPDWEEARSMVDSEWRLEPEGRSGGAGDHYRVGCGGRYFRGPGWRKPPRASISKALEKRKRDAQRGRGD